LFMWFSCRLSKAVGKCPALPNQPSSLKDHMG
jgi:hypothetical protein